MKGKRTSKAGSSQFGARQRAEIAALAKGTAVAEGESIQPAMQ